MVALNNSAVFLEALDIGAQWGLSPDKIRDIMHASSGRNWGTDNWEVFKKFTRFVVIDDPNMVNTAIKDIAVAREWAEQAHFDVATLPYVAEIIRHAYKVSPILKQALWPDAAAR